MEFSLIVIVVVKQIVLLIDVLYLFLFNRVRARERAPGIPVFMDLKWMKRMSRQ